MSDWPEPVQRVAEFLREAGAEARLEQFETGAHTAQEAAKAIGCELAQIVKSLVFECEGRPVLALVPGDRRADSAKIARAVGAERARIAGPEQVEQATGFVPGAVAPFPLPRVRDILLEQTLLSHERVWIGAGSTRHMAGLAPTELARLARARPVDAVESGT